MNYATVLRLRSATDKCLFAGNCFTYNGLRDGTRCAIHNKDKTFFNRLYKKDEKNMFIRDVTTNLYG
jgi:hypothetical protein